MCIGIRQIYQTSLTNFFAEFCAEPKCGPMRGGEQFVPLTTTSPAFSESDFPQPLVVRSPSVSLLKWPSPKNTPSRQVCL